MYQQILDDDFNEFIQYILDRHVEKIPRRNFVDRENPLETYSDGEFRNRYHLSKETVTDSLLPLFHELDSRRGVPLPPVLRLLTCLRFYSTGNFQGVCGDLVHASQSTVSRFIKDVSSEIASRLWDLVKMPSTDQEIRNFKRRFRAIKNYPDVIGCVDCTHIPVQNPGGQFADQYKNRKGWSSLNVQLVVGPDMEITNVVTRWPGSTHDARVFLNSQVRARLEKGELKGIILGDMAYPQLPYLHTPLAKPKTEPERRYNAAHMATRCVVGRALREWKRRFPCLAVKLRTKMETSVKIILACAVLHNIAVQRGDVLPNSVPEVPSVDVPVAALKSGDRRGALVRDAFIIRHFGRGCNQ